jgi:hypothetical protein
MMQAIEDFLGRLIGLFVPEKNKMSYALEQCKPYLMDHPDCHNERRSSFLCHAIRLSVELAGVDYWVGKRARQEIMARISPYSLLIYCLHFKGEIDAISPRLIELELSTAVRLDPYVRKRDAWLDNLIAELKRKGK